jgi:hypothetical protein
MRTKKLDAMTMAYLEAALWADLRDDYGDPLDEYSILDIAESSRESALADCERFYVANAVDLDNMSSEQVGHDFWLTRNGHGAGFWDRGLGNVGERLTLACKQYCPLCPILGDDGLIYLE